MTKPSTTYLLGAGASVDANLPTSTELTRLITEEVDAAGRYNGVAQALHAAIGAMVAHDTGLGGSAFDGIDVERLFAAIQMLADRENLEIAPFVSSWNQNLDGLGASKSLPAFWARDFKKELNDERFGDFGLERAFTSGVKAVSGTPDLRPALVRLQAMMVGALGKILAVDPDAVDYLMPLLASEHRPIQIATLNYDRSVEVLAQKSGVSCDTGIRNWDGGYDWKWNDAAEVRLLKLHGSLDWYLSSPRDESRLQTDKVVLAQDLGEEQKPQMSDRLALVFGQGAKLRSDGPFLAMLVELDRMLKQTDRLVVVGYSFRDDHINAAIRRWHNERESPSLIIINPALSDWNEYQNAPAFYRELFEVMHTRGQTTELRSGHLLLAMAAAEGLKEVS